MLRVISDDKLTVANENLLWFEIVFERFSQLVILIAESE